MEALSDMPPRREQELDAVTLHNQASTKTSRDFSCIRSYRTHSWTVCRHKHWQLWDVFTYFSLFAADMSFNPRLFFTWRKTQPQVFAS